MAAHILHSLEELQAWAPGPLAVTVGFFDGVHLGHRHLIQRLIAQAAEHRAWPLVVTFANSPRAFHQQHGEWRYLTLPEEKLELLSETGAAAVLMLEYNAKIARQSARGFFQWLASAAPLAALCLGYDTTIGCDMLAGHAALADLAAGLGLAFDFVGPLTQGGAAVKSSRARDLVLRGEMEQAREVLGHAYFVLGKVSAGKGKGGAQLSAPTANVYLPYEKITPPTGVYAGIGHAGGAAYPAAVVVLTRAQAQHTVLEHGTAEPEPAGDPAQVLIEAHLIGFSGSIYGQQVTVELLKRLREFRSFDSREELIAQIRMDVEQARALALAEGAV